MCNALVLMLLAQTPAPPPEDKHPDLPPLAVLRAFPWTNADAREQVRRHDNHLAYLAKMQDAFPAWRDQIQVWQQETADRCALWCKLANATVTPTCEVQYSEQEKREALAYLRMFLGNERFWKGEMPAPFAPIDYPPLYLPPKKMPRDDSIIAQ